MNEADHPRILIVDDERYNVDLIEAYLIPEYEVLKAYDGEESLRQVQEGVDLILLDIMMPGLSGYDVCRILKNNEDTRHIPVIMITALFEDSDRQKALYAGADEFLSKPVEQIELETRIKSLLRTKRLNDNLIAEKNQLHQYLEFAGVLITVLDRKGNIVLANRKASEVFGYPEEKIIGWNWFDNFVPEHKKEELFAAFRAIVEGKAELMEYHEYSVITKNGAEKIISWHNSLLLDEQGNVCGLLTSGEDITAKKRAEKALKEYAAELKHSNELKDLFIDIMRHDLLNFAGLVKGFSAILLKEARDENQECIIKMLQKNNMKIIELINHASHFAQLESLKTVDMEKINLSEIASEVLVDLDAEIREREISVANLTRGPCVALANPLIREVFLNFLSNAIKYSPEKSKITIDIKDTGDVWKIMVIDSGEGISGKDKMRVFERFIRVNHVPVKGMGIGLAIVKRIIDFHGGEVGVEDNPEGKGSIFWATVGKA